MGTIKLAVLAFLLGIKNYLLNLLGEVEELGRDLAHTVEGVAGHLTTIFDSALHAALAVISVPLQTLTRVWNCLKHTGEAVASLWNK